MDMNLKPGVVNVLIDYVLKINNNKLTRNFIEIIASQWAKSKVETVESAMKIAEKEYKNRKKYLRKKLSNPTRAKFRRQAFELFCRSEILFSFLALHKHQNHCRNYKRCRAETDIQKYAPLVTPFMGWFIRSLSVQRVYQCWIRACGGGRRLFWLARNLKVYRVG